MHGKGNLQHIDNVCASETHDGLFFAEAIVMGIILVIQTLGLADSVRSEYQYRNNERHEQTSLHFKVSHVALQVVTILFIVVDAIRCDFRLPIVMQYMSRKFVDSLIDVNLLIVNVQIPRRSLRWNSPRYIRM